MNLPWAVGNGSSESDVGSFKSFLELQFCLGVDCVLGHVKCGAQTGNLQEVLTRAPYPDVLSYHPWG